MQPRLAATALLVAFVLLIIACAGRGPAPRPPVTTDKMPADVTQKIDKPKDDAKVEKPRDPAMDKPDFVWTAAELKKEYGQNGAALRALHGGKIVELKSKLFDFDPFGYYAPKQTIVMNLEGPPGFIICHMADQEPWAKVVPEVPITVRGRIPKPDENVVEPLVQTVIIEPKQSPALQLTSEQLVRDARADSKKYFKKYMVVSGEVLRTNKVNALYLEIKGDDQTNVRCQIPSKLKHTIDPLMVGQKIKVYGMYVTLRPEGVILDKALPITRTGE